MRARSIFAATSVGAAAVIAGPLAAPASAGVTAATSGTTVVVTVTGDETVNFRCPSGNLAIVTSSGTTPATPTLACAAVTQVTVNGDAGGQRVVGSDLNDPAFAANPKIITTLGDGADVVMETDQADQISLGAGDDWVDLKAGGAINGTVDLGAGTNDYLAVAATAANNAISAISSSTSASVVVTYPTGSSTSAATNAERLIIRAGAGDDSITTTGVTAASSIDNGSFEGGPGNDTLTDGVINSYLYGGAGTNTLSGGDGQDSYWSESNTDTIAGGDDANTEWIYDTDGLRSGGRTLSGFTALDHYTVQAHQGDVTQRIRPGTGGSTVFTTSLTRTGQQIVPAPIGYLALGQAYAGALPHKGLADVVATNDQITVTLPATGGGLIDVTIPSGSFTASLVGTTLSVSSSSYGQISAGYVGSASQYRAHGPWTNKNQGFAHRAYRDLLFRFPSDTVRDQVRDQLASGAKTRAAVAQGLIDTDEYRGLDADRVYLEYLRRTSDPGGRSYWIGALRDGRPLWRFRAQLVGSNEYFTKAGGTNDSFVTQVYRDVLGREPDPGGLAHWVAKLDGGAERGMVALQFINAAEVRHRVVDDQFLRFLDRLPTSSEQSSWSASLTAPDGEQAMIAALVSSASYYNRS